MITPKELQAKYFKEKDSWSAASASWDVQQASSAISALVDMLRNEAYQDDLSDARTLVNIVRELANFLQSEIGEVATELDTPSIMYKEAKSRFLTTKEGDQYRWTMITGSAFEDKDGEIISEKAFERDCDEMELTNEYGELLWWHCDGTQHAQDKEARPYIPLGKCDTSFVYEKLNIESGFYYDNEVGQLFTDKASEFGASKSFYHKEDEPDKDGVYTLIRTKERSLLPRTKEANFLTRLFGHKEKEMATNKERQDALKEKLGEEKFNQLLETGKDMSAKAEKFLASKEMKADMTDEEKKAAEKKKKDMMDGDTMKEESEKLMLSIKESNDKLALQLKEQGETFTKEFTAFKELQTKELDELKTNMAEAQSTLAALMGLQPKSGFKASEKGAKPELNAEQAKLAAEAEKSFSSPDVLDWLVKGTPIAA